MAMTFEGNTPSATLPGPKHEETFQPRKRLAISTEHTSHFIAGPEVAEFEDDSDDSCEEIDSEDESLEVEYLSVITAEANDPWIQKIVLSLDGGAHRNYATLLILQALMKRIEKLEQEIEPGLSDSARSPESHLSSTNSPAPSESRFRPCHYFDYIGGASTGGLIAILLGRMRRPVDEALEIFVQFSHTMFPNFPRMGISHLPRVLNNKTRSEKLAAQLDWSKPTDSGPEEDGQSFVSDSLRCRTIVCAMERTQLEDHGMKPYLFRSYDHEARDGSSYLRNPGAATTRLRTADVAKAAVAASRFQNYFPIEQHSYYDSGPGLNNPSLELYNEITSLHDLDSLALFLSIGCGGSKPRDPSTTQSNSRAWKLKSSLKRQEKELSLGADAVHDRIQKKSHSQASPFEYFRFDVKEDITDSSLEDWRNIQPGRHALRKIAAVTQTYLAQREVGARLDECAKQLVRRRRLRAETLQWESFALGVRYGCPHPVECQVQKDKVRFATRDALLDHLRTVHKEPPPDANNFERINSLLDRGRINSDRSEGS